MGADLFDDRRRRLLVRRRVGPLAAGMQRVAQGALVDPGFRAVAVLAQAAANFRFRIPDRLEEIDQVVLGRFLEARLHDEEAAFGVVDVERGDDFADAARVLVEPGRQLGALADRVLGGLVVRIGLADVDRVVHALERRVGAEVAAVVDGVNAGILASGCLVWAIRVSAITRPEVLGSVGAKMDSERSTGSSLRVPFFS